MDNNKTCSLCKRSYNTEQMHKVGKRWLCQECYNEYVHTEAGQKEILIDFIWNLYDKEYRTSQIFFLIKSQIEYYHNNDEYQFKYTGMLKALQEHLTFENYKWKNQYGLGQVFPNIYYKAQDRYNRIQNIKKAVVQHPCYSSQVTIKTQRYNRKQLLPLE